MEESRTEASQASGDSSQVAPTPTFTLEELIQGHRLLEERATQPTAGLPFIDRPDEALAILFDERAGAALDELWARRAVLVEGVEEEEGVVYERALLIGEPCEEDVRRPTARFWLSTKNSEVASSSETDAAPTPTCLLSHIQATDDSSSADLQDWDDINDEPEAEEVETDSPTETLDGLPRVPVGPPRFQRALLPALRVLIATADEDSHVLYPLDVVRDTLHTAGIRGDDEMGFINWLVQADLIFILVVGPKAIFVRNEARALLTMQADPAAQAKPAPKKRGPTDTPFAKFRGKRFSADLIAAAIVALIEAADDNAEVRLPVLLLGPVLTACGEDPARATGLFDKLVERDFVERSGRTRARVLEAGVRFAKERRQALELVLRTMESAPVSEAAPLDQPSMEELPEGDVEGEAEVLREGPEAAADQEVASDDVPEVEASTPIEAAPTTDAEDGLALAPVATLEPESPPSLLPIVIDEELGGEVEEVTEPTLEAPPRRSVVLTPASQEKLQEYLRMRVDATAEGVLSELIVQHLGPRVQQLETALELSYQILWQRRSKDRTHRGKPVAFTPVALLGCYPPHVRGEEAAHQLEVMVRRGWIRWVRPRKDRSTGRRPPAYIVLLRAP